MIKKIARLGVGLVCAGLLAVGFAGPANALASDGADSDGVASTVTDTITVSPGDSETVESSDGSFSTTLTLGTPEIVTVADVQADPNLSATSEIVAAAAAATIKSNHWSQFTTGAVYTQTQNGTFYDNGSRVWVTQTYSGRTGSHVCLNNDVLDPWAISNVSKSDSGSTTQRVLYCGWNVKQANTGITTSAAMTAKISKTGTISGFGSSVG